MGEGRREKGEERRRGGEGYVIPERVCVRTYVRGDARRAAVRGWRARSSAVRRALVGCGVVL